MCCVHGMDWRGAASRDQWENIPVCRTCTPKCLGVGGHGVCNLASVKGKPAGSVWGRRERGRAKEKAGGITCDQRLMLFAQSTSLGPRPLRRWLPGLRSSTRLGVLRPRSHWRVLPPPPHPGNVFPTV